MARKRAPGGGRKPKGAVAAGLVAVRMQDDLRAQLDAAAKKRGYTLTDEVLGRLRASFAREREQRRDRAMRALGFLIATVADVAHLGGRLNKQWHRDPFMFQAF